MEVAIKLAIIFRVVLTAVAVWDLYYQVWTKQLALVRKNETKNSYNYNKVNFLHVTVETDSGCSEPNMCSQLCVNISGTVACSCNLGYTLLANEEDCES